MTHTNSADQSHGYETAAEDFMSVRSSANIGVTTVRDWAKQLPRGGEILDIGCGHGVPNAKALIEDGFSVYGVDASVKLIAAFRACFPNAQAECAAVEHSSLFARSFDGILACGLMFLLPPDVQATIIHKVALALKPGGRFLFTAPKQVCEWQDNLTGYKSISLGADVYRKLVETEGMVLAGEAKDEGQNHYYFVCKPANYAWA